MAYDIELMSLGDDIYPLLERSALDLNRTQDEFRFRLTRIQRQAGLAFQRLEYVTPEVWAFLKDQRRIFGGYRPYIIAFVSKPLQSTEYANIFGSHEGKDGLAVVTTFHSAQYEKEATRYCCYYLVRYTLSFINPLIRAHGDDARKDCYFHFKRYKPDIKLSMNSGNICDQCMTQLDHPTPGGVAHQLSDEEREALRRMRDFISRNLPYAIIMKGGGVKGLAFAGALLELGKYYWFDRHVGTSAGAIAAALLAAEYTPEELADLLFRKNFQEFMDAPAWKVPLNLLFRQGCYPGESC